MRRLLLAYSLLLASARPFAGDDLSTDLPAAIPDMSGWEVVTGEIDNARMQANYRFYVNPEREALYQVIHYRVRLFGPTAEAGRRYPPTEKLVWNEKPGRAHLRCFERVPAGSGRGVRWAERAHGTPDYLDEMGMVVQILALHRQARLGQEQQ